MPLEPGRRAPTGRDLPARATRPALVVGADDTLRDACLVLLRANGWSAIGASTCEEAVRVAERVRLRAVVFDIVTATDWFHCRQLRQAVPDAPVVVLSATCTPDRWYRSMAQRLGCAGFVMKPCAPDVVLDTLRRTCAGEPWVECVG
jgi:DNA-binding NarL/FixJ family response regulator